MNYWYVARPNELFLDIDNAPRSLKHARARLQGAIECGKLNVLNVAVLPSRSENHIHAIITLEESLIDYERYAWEVILHGDIYRACCNIMRTHNDIPAADILISPCWMFRNGSGYARQADDECKCHPKHKASIMETCPAAKRLRGKFRNAGFFGKPSKNPCTIWPEL
jgi:hypothetical protein